MLGVMREDYTVHNIQASSWDPFRSHQVEPQLQAIHNVLHMDCTNCNATGHSDVCVASKKVLHPVTECLRWPSKEVTLGCIDSCAINPGQGSRFSQGKMFSSCNHNFFATWKATLCCMATNGVHNMNFIFQTMV